MTFCSPILIIRNSSDKLLLQYISVGRTSIFVRNKIYAFPAPDFIDSLLSAFLGDNSTESGNDNCYCCFRVTDLEVTVKIQRMVIFTAGFEYFRAQIAVAGASFFGFDCHHASEI